MNRTDAIEIDHGYGLNASLLFDFMNIEGE